MKKVTKSRFAALMLTLMSASLAATPDGYSVNSDGESGNADSLYRINLADGQHTRLGRVQSQGQTRLDVEGLAFAPDGTLYGMDDESMMLFPLNVDNGVISSQKEVKLQGLPLDGQNDFGMSFGCDNNLYVTSVITDSLYRVSLTGVAQRIGNAGSLSANISAIAAFGNPVQLYGLGNGLDKNLQVDSRMLYSINTTTGVASPIGALGDQADPYNEGGLAFDNDGDLWAITDRRNVAGIGEALPSQILQLNTGNGAATAVGYTSELGFESLAITVPRGCSTSNGEIANFTVQKRFVDGNDITPVTVNLSCNGGSFLDQTKTVLPNEGVFGAIEVRFVVDDFIDGELSCTLTELPPEGYTPSYTCLGESECEAPQSTESCTFNEVSNGTDNLCQVQNYPDPVNFTVSKQWLFEDGTQGIADAADITLECVNTWDGSMIVDRQTWSWPVSGVNSTTTAVFPSFDGSTQCRAIEKTYASAIESENGCADWIPVNIGDESLSCEIVNTVFFEGIPTLSELGKFLFILVMLAGGLVAIRRI